MHKIWRSTFLLSILLYVIYAVLVPTKGNYDTECWAQWSAYIFENGLGKAYGSGTNYLPGHLYELKLYSLFFNSAQSVIEHINYLKYFTLLFDVAGALLVCSLIRDASKQHLVLLVIMLNPAYLHNDLLWGQFDSVFSTLVFASFLSAYQRRFVLAGVLYLIALNFKLQAIIFFPPMFLFMIYQSGLKINWRKFMVGLSGIVALQVLILLPFIINSETNSVWNAVKGLGGRYGQISLYAANFWHWIIPGGDLRWMSDRIELLGMPLKKLGLILVVMSYAFVSFPLVRLIFLKLKSKSTSFSFSQLISMFALCALTFFYFNTQMHERYSFPAFLFLAALSLVTGRWWLYGLFSVAYFLNNEKVLQAFTVYDYQSYIFDLRFSSAIFLFLILALVWFLYPFWKKTPAPATDNPVIG